MNVSWLNHRGGRCKTWIKISEQNNVHLVLKIIGVYNCCTLDVYISKHCKLEWVWWMSRHCNDDAIMAALFCSLSFGSCLHNAKCMETLRDFVKCWFWHLFNNGSQQSVQHIQSESNCQNADPWNISIPTVHDSGCYESVSKRLHIKVTCI